MAVVERLEPVEVAEEQRQCAALFVRAFDLLAETLVQVAVVVEAGETVGDRVQLGARQPASGGLEHRGKGLRDVAAQTLHLVRRRLRRGHVDGDDEAHIAVEVTHRDEAADPYTPLVDREHVRIRINAGERFGQLLVGDDLAADVCPLDRIVL